MNPIAPVSQQLSIITFRLKPDFLKQYIDRKPPFGFNGLGELIFYRTYSRLKDDGTNEQWWETIKRVVEGTYSIQKRWILGHRLGWNEEQGQRSAQEMYDRMYNMKFLPPGRGLWAMGSPLTEERGIYASLLNCAYVSTENIDKDKADPFCFLMEASMLGIGTGFDTRGAGKLIIRKPSSEIETFEIPDSREGWVESLRKLLLSYFDGAPTVTFDYSKIRPAGEPLKGFGGIASGPDPLRDMHEVIRDILDRSVNEAMSITNIVDIMNLVGKCVVSGNIRRCLPKGTLIHTQEGLVPIEKICAGTMVKTSDSFSRVSELVHQGEQAVWEVRTQLGWFRATDRHKMAVMTDVGEYEWRPLRDLRSGDRLVFVEGGVPGGDTALPSWTYEHPLHSTTVQDIMVPNLDANMAWFIGLLQGDGYVFANHKNNGFNAHVSVACHSEDYPSIVDAAMQQMSRFGVRVYRREIKGEKTIKISAQSKQLAWYLDKYVKQPRTPLNVPIWILQGTKEIRAAYIAGIFDSDGSQQRPLVVASSVYEGFLKQIQALLASIGIPSRLQLHRFAKGAWQSLYNLNMVGERALQNWQDIVGPYSHKHTNIEGRRRSGWDYGFPADWVTHRIDYRNAWSSNNTQMTVATAVRCGADIQSLVPVTVLKVIPNVAVVDTYDITVPDAEEFVCGEGLLVHNTAEIVFGDPQSDEYLDLKNYEVNPHRAEYGWTSNNSVFAELGMDYSPVCERIVLNGEPGFAWLGNMRAYGRMGDRPNNRDRRAAGGNPCITAETVVMTTDGPRTVSQLLNKTFVVAVADVDRKSEGFFPTGYKEVFRLMTKEGHELRLTADHKVLTTRLTEKTQYDEWKEAKDLRPGDLVVLNNVRGRHWKGEGTREEGWLLGNLIGDGHFHTNGAKLQFWGTHKDHMLKLALDRIETLGGDPRYHNQRTGTAVIERDMVSTGSVQLTHLATYFGISSSKTLHREKLLTTSSAFQRGFVCGLFDADGSVQGTQMKGVNVRLRSVCLEHLTIVQEMLVQLGINSTLYRNRSLAGTRQLPDGRGGLKEYPTQTSHELVISGENLFEFRRIIGFDDPAKQKKLDLLLEQYQRKPNRESFVATFLELAPDGMDRVFDCVVDDIHRFGANGFVVHNCLEQTLESYECCCLVETFPTNHNSLEDFQRTLKFAYLYAKTVTLGPTPWEKTNKVMLRNRRIGCSMSGIVQAISKLGIEEFRKWCEEGYKTIQNWDEVYSDWLAIPRSIKMTSVKPSGTVSLLTGSTPGMHFPESRTYIRRVRIAKNSDLLDPLMQAGYSVEPCFGDESSMVVSIPVRLEDDVRTVYEVSMWEQLALAAFMQRYWTDNQVSCTVSFDPDTEGSQIKHALQYYQYQLKGISFLPRKPQGAYVQMPYQKISEAEYKRLTAGLKPLHLQARNERAEVERFCDSSVCDLSVAA